MSTVDILSGKFKDPNFWDFMNYFYYPINKMQDSVEFLEQKYGKQFVKDIKYGDYQDKLFDFTKWSEEGAKIWQESKDAARTGLYNQPNNIPVLGRDYSDPANIPKTKLLLLDATINYCFNTTAKGQAKNGIPMIIDVQEKIKGTPGDNLHDIHISWTYEPGNPIPVQLNWTMICPAP